MLACLFDFRAIFLSPGLFYTRECQEMKLNGILNALPAAKAEEWQTFLAYSPP
jgi:hypothetical protein